MDAQENEQAVIARFQENAIPLQHVEAGNGIADLQPLKQILKDVKVVGLGEATHGTREFFQLKHRLVEFLVTEMGFDTFTMDETLIDLIEQAGPDARFVIWEHNVHISVANTATEEHNIGSYLRERYGPRYLGFALESNHIYAQTRSSLPDGCLSDLNTVTLPPASPESLAGHLARIKLGLSLWDLRAAAGNPAMEQWLATPRTTHFVSWRHRDDEADNYKLSPVNKYDGIIFVDRTTPARPTANALRAASAGEKA